MLDPAIRQSMGQKLNTTSTTESELVGASDCLGQTLWTVNFLEHQGIEVKKNYYYQDNESAIRLEKNGIKSAGKRSRHINIRFYYIKDRIDKGDIQLMYCNTKDMVADFFSKAQQGALFGRMADMAMGHAPMPKIEDPPLSSPATQERVGNDDFGVDGQRTEGGHSDNRTNKRTTNEPTKKSLTWADRVRRSLQPRS